MSSHGKSETVGSVAHANDMNMTATNANDSAFTMPRRALCAACSVLLVGLTAGVVQAQTPSAANEVVLAKPKTQTAQTSVAADNPLQIADNAPTIYTVVKGDTLWDISGKFLKQPWRWPEIWNMNRDQIKNPHWIYPGDVIKLSFDASGRPSLSIVGAGGADGTTRISPRIRSEPITEAIPSIPARVIGPFLSMPLVAEETALSKAPRIIATDDNRVVVGSGNIVYAAGITEGQGTKFQIYRPGKALVDPNTKEVLGYEAGFLGEARVMRFGKSLNEPTTLEIVRSTQEVNRGDRLTPAPDAMLPTYSPRAPEKKVNGNVIAVLGGVNESAQYSIVALNLGKREGMEIGHVLQTLRAGAVVATDVTQRSDGYDLRNLIPKALRKNDDGIPLEMKLPDERNGLMVVFRVFDRVSYALVVSSKRQIVLNDPVRNP
jgi:LysM repeat protein